MSRTCNFYPDDAYFEDCIVLVEAADCAECDGENYLGCKYYCGPDSKAQADARIRDAAPELLEALEDVLRRIGVSEEWWIDSPSRGGFDVRGIRAAIARAKGE